MRILTFHQVLRRANSAQALQFKGPAGNVININSNLFLARLRHLSTSGSNLLAAGKTPENGGGVAGVGGSETDAVLKKKYSDTIQLPKSKFPMKVPFEMRNQHELKLAEEFQFDQLYTLQRLWRQDQPEFILHDGPPYANGNVHIGHAVNKILKDITNRYKLLRGYKVNYIPGWDCHGLPIELKVLKADISAYKEKPLEIRQRARKIVDAAIKSQKDSFKRWGVMAEWESVYRTLDKSSLQAELKAFYNLYKKKLVFRDFKPVYWSPSSGSCLAESELEYDNNHKSPSVYVTLELNADINEFAKALGKDIGSAKNGPVKAVIWTTTPWTLPSNKAIAFNENQEYSVLELSHHYASDKSYLIVATHLVKDVTTAVAKTYLAPVFTFSGSQLSSFKYRHPLFEDQLCPFLHGSHVAGDKGTGLVHTAPAHGHDDFVLGLKHNLSMECFVDNEGNFDDQIKGLKGLPVLSGGNKAVLNKIKDKVLKETSIIHSYPYDWRTKKPVIIKTSLQWFLDTDKLKADALKQLEEVKIFPSNVQNSMGQSIANRPFWCISRQRTWGVPIPVLYHKKSGQPYVDENLINELCKLIETTGGLDFWWETPVSELIKDEKVASEYEKGTDIFDIWLDSGLTWQLLGDKVADVYLEGQDQFQGWFQSSLLTSVGLRGYTPFKNLYVHGFVVDDEGRKMSKSLGNVVDPKIIIEGCSTKQQRSPAFGADVLRWWVAAQGSADGCNISLGNTLLKASDDGVQKLRNTLRFLISFCNEEAIAELDINTISYDELMYTDQYMLHLLKDFQRQVTEHYESMNYHRVLMKALHFGTTEISAQYFTWAKDRLYCDDKKSESRKSCIYVLNQIYLTFAKVLAPILPFLIEETYSHYQIQTGHNSIFKSTWFDVNDPAWNNEQIASIFQLILDVRTSLNHVIGANNPKDIWVELICDAEAYKKLELLHPVEEDDIVDKCDSELCDLLQVSGVELKLLDNTTSKTVDGITNVNFSTEPVGVSHSLAGYSLGISKSPMSQCARCRRYCCVEGNVLCSRCMSVMQRILRKQSQEEQEQVSTNNTEELKEMISKKT